MKKEVSKFLTLNIFDILKGLIMFALAAIGEFSIQLFNILLTNTPDGYNLFKMFNVGLIATISYLIKQYFTGRKQSPEPFKPEKIK
jgi:hypothetical protein